MRLPLLLPLVLIGFASSVLADSMRCGKWVVNEETSVAELLEKCGPPQEKTSQTEDDLAVNAAGYAFKTGTTTTTEQWRYQKSSRSLPMVVTIVNGKVKSLQRAD